MQGEAPPAGEPARLSLNERHCGPAAAARRLALDELARAKWHYYPEGEYDRLAQCLAEHVGVMRHNIIPTNGADEALLLCALFLRAKGSSRAFIPSPTFTMYEWAARCTGLEYRLFPWRPPDFTLPRPEELSPGRWEGRSQAAPVLFLCRPNNPTGHIVSAEAACEYLEAGWWVVLDEAYIEFAGPDVSLSPWIERQPRLIIVRTLSKAFALAGLRVGYLVAAGETAAEMDHYRLPFNLSLLSCIVARHVMTHAADERGEINAIVNTREWFRDHLAEEAPWIRIFPSETNFLLLDFGSAGEAERALDTLRRVGIAVRSYSEPAMLSSCLRVSIGPRPLMDRVLGCLADLRREAGVDE